MLEAFYLAVGGIFRISTAKNKENITSTRSIIFSMSGYVPKFHYGIFVKSQWYRQYKNVFMESMLCLVSVYVTWERLKTIQTNIQILMKIMRQQRKLLL